MTNANDFFGASNGSENFYQHRFSPIIYTDGVKAMADDCGAYWFLDAVISNQVHNVIKLQPFQVWKLERTKDSAFIIVGSDGNNNRLAHQHVPNSDFKYDLATVWLVDGCLMLPKEY